MYQINLSVTQGDAGNNGNSIIGSSLVLLEVEQLDSQFHDRWHGEFTSQYIEEITHKAGNFKKFNVFVKMLCAAFTEEKDSVLFVDLLTYADLELLKARKSGSGSQGLGSHNSNQAAILANKRYVILTYSGEFDRVHYPLPLMHEDPMAPNVTSLRRTITRLRQQLSEQGAAYQANTSMTANNGADKSASEKDRERDNVRQIVTQLRQDNTELRHRLRQADSRAASAMAASNGSSKSGHRGGSSSTSANSAELVASNGKLRSQVDALRKELTASTTAYEKLRIESAKFKMRLSAVQSGASGSALGLVSEDMQSVAGQTHQQRLQQSNLALYMSGTGATDAPSSSLVRLDAARGSVRTASGSATATVTATATANEREMALRRRIAALERDLSLATTATSGGASRSGSAGRARTPSTHAPSRARPSSSVSPWQADHRRPTSASGGGGSRTATSRPATPTLPPRSSTPPVSRGRAGGSGQVRHSSASPSSRGHPRGDAHASSQRGSTSSAGSRPSTPTRVSGQTPRFDPTAYQRNKEDAQDRRERGRREWEKARRSASADTPSEDRRGRRAPPHSRRNGYGSDDYGAGVGSDRGRSASGTRPPRSSNGSSSSAALGGRSRYGSYESGYSSAGSQASRRSARSVGSVGSDCSSQRRQGQSSRDATHRSRPPRRDDGEPFRGRSWISGGSDVESEAKAPSTVKKQRRKADDSTGRDTTRQQPPSHSVLHVPAVSDPPGHATGQAGGARFGSAEAVLEAGSVPRIRHTGKSKKKPVPTSTSTSPLEAHQLPDSVTHSDVQQQVMQHLQQQQQLQQLQQQQLQRSPRASEEVVARSPPLTSTMGHPLLPPTPADSPDSPDSLVTADHGKQDKENVRSWANTNANSHPGLAGEGWPHPEDQVFDCLLSLAKENMHHSQRHSHSQSQSQSQSQIPSHRQSQNPSPGQGQSHHSVSFAPAVDSRRDLYAMGTNSPVLDAAVAVLSSAKMSASVSTPIAADKAINTSTNGTPIDSSSPAVTAAAAAGTPEGDISEIDRRILALQNYLESARVGILRESIGGSS